MGVHLCPLVCIVSGGCASVVRTPAAPRPIAIPARRGQEPPLMPPLAAPFLRTRVVTAATAPSPLAGPTSVSRTPRTIGSSGCPVSACRRPTRLFAGHTPTHDGYPSTSAGRLTVLVGPSLRAVLRSERSIRHQSGCTPTRGPHPANRHCFRQKSESGPS